jgi:ABC-2 type transport system permease protein
MGVISGERKSGVAGIILVKPVAFSAFITAKWAAALLLIWISYFIGFIASWYYVGILFEWIPFGDFIYVYLTYGVWLSFVLTITVFFNTLFKSPGVVGFCAIATVIVVSLVSGSLSHVLEWSPAQLSSYSREFLVTASFPEAALPAILLALGGILLLLIGSVLIFRRKELAA